MNQVSKFYLASFLKNQIYFVPIMIVFFQDVGLSLGDIFWIFTIGSGFSFLIEIPTGIFADLYGKRKSIIISKLLIALSFIAFGFSSNFISLIFANLLYELGKSFRSGTETAYVYDYLEQNKDAPSYTLVKANQKFYARISESIGTALGGFLAVYLGFNFVFFVASVPAVINFIHSLSWEEINENKVKITISESLDFTKKSFKEVLQNSMLKSILINIMLYSVILASIEKFIQPYMGEIGIKIEYFGIIYSTFLILVAFLARHAHKLEKKYGEVNIANKLTYISVIPLLILGIGFKSLIGVGLFFLVLMIGNVRAPIVNTLFHKEVSSSNRATMGSILELAESFSQLLFLPLIGFITDSYSMFVSILALGIIMAFGSIMFRLKESN